MSQKYDTLVWRQYATPEQTLAADVVDLLNAALNVLRPERDNDRVQRFVGEKTESTTFDHAAEFLAEALIRLYPSLSIDYFRFRQRSSETLWRLMNAERVELILALLESRAS